MSDHTGVTIFNGVLHHLDTAASPLPNVIMCHDADYDAAVRPAAV